MKSWTVACFVLQLVLLKPAMCLRGGRILYTKFALAGKPRVIERRLKSNFQLLNDVSLNRCDTYASKLKEERWGGSVIGPIARYLNSLIVGTFFRILLTVFNKFRSHNSSTLFDLIFKRKTGQPLLSVSNHQSVLDDPGLWGALLPYWMIRPDVFRWNICTEDVFFSLPFLTTRMFGAGNVMPLDRSGSLEQPMFRKFYEKLAAGKWCHIFPEGKIFQDWRFDDEQPKLGPFKPGIGKLIAHLPQGVDPIIVPIYHTGMDRIVPEFQLKKGSKKRSRPISKWPGLGKEVNCYVGKPFSLKGKVNEFRKEHPHALDSWKSSPESIDFYIELTNEIKKKVLELEDQVRKGVIDGEEEL